MRKIEDQIINLLQSEYHIDKKIIEEIQIEQKSANISFKNALLETKLILEDIYYQLFAKLTNKKYITSIEANKKFNWTLYKYIDNNEIFEQMIKLKIFPAFIENKTLYLTEIDGNNSSMSRDMFIIKMKEYLMTLNEKLGFENIDFVLVSENVYKKFELTYKAPTINELKQIFKNIPAEIDLTNKETNNDVRLFLQAMFILAISKNTSDIHIESSIHNKHRISFRMMGDKTTIVSLNSKKITNIVNIIKQMSGMDASITQTSQDGHIDGGKLLKNITLPIKRLGFSEVEFNFDEVTFRISALPTVPPMGGGEIDVNYESIVIRILGADSTLASLDFLGISNQSKQELKFASTKSKGIILITGPTGSGKSTTLYAVLSNIDFLGKKLITFEDPVERINPYWSQTQKALTSNKKTNFGFEEAKKAILRQDPDVILMGEIRDNESAKFAIEEANTGHLVLSTIHTNSAADTIDRLKDLNIDPKEISGSIIAIFAQRLVKKVCPKCSKKRVISTKEIDVLKRLEVDIDKYKNIELTFKNPNGCDYCHNTGYIGRILLDEVISVDRGLKELINKNAPSYEIQDYTISKGFNTLIDNGIIKCQNYEIDFYDLVSLL